jgi:hypothetical protein
MPAKVEVKSIVLWDVRFELATLKGIAELHGVSDAEFDFILGFAGELLTWAPPEGTTDIKAAVLRHIEDATQEFVIERSSGELRFAIPEILLLGAAISSLLRKWHVEAHPEAAEQPEIVIEPITYEEYEELKKKGVITPIINDEESIGEVEEEEWVADGTEGWIGGGENRDVV